MFVAQAPRTGPFPSQVNPDSTAFDAAGLYGRTAPFSKFGTIESRASQLSGRLVCSRPHHSELLSSDPSSGFALTTTGYHRPSTSSMTSVSPVHSLSASSAPVIIPRKRSMSFSEPQPMKSPRPLKRTGSYLSLPDVQSSGSQHQRSGSSMSTTIDCSPRVPYNRTLRYYKEQRDRQRKASLRPAPSTPIIIQPVVVESRPAKPTGLPLRTSSPLSPVRAILPPRASFPRSKPEPDLYRVALTTRLRMSPNGQKILHMGPRLAFSIFMATQELERIVAAQRDKDNDIVMGTAEAGLSNSWVVVPPEDWEMIDCAC